MYKKFFYCMYQKAKMYFSHYFTFSHLPQNIFPHFNQTLSFMFV